METGEVDQALTEPQQDVTQPETPSAEHVEVAPADVQKEAVTEPQKPAAPEKTYTQAELDKARAEATATKDREIAQHRQALAQVAMERQIEQIQAAEAIAQARDARALENGEITEEQAVERRQGRYAAVQKRFADQQAARQSEQEIRREAEGVAAMRAEGTSLGRALAANDLAKEYGVDAKELLADASLTTPQLMENKALKIANAALRAQPEKFDSGQPSGTSVSEEQSLKARYPTMFKK